jgi:hypothetical protein
VRVARCDWDQKEQILQDYVDERAQLEGWLSVELLLPLDRSGRPTTTQPLTLGQPPGSPDPPMYPSSIPGAQIVTTVIPQTRFLFCSTECASHIGEKLGGDQSG